MMCFKTMLAEEFYQSQSADAPYTSDYSEESDDKEESEKRGNGERCSHGNRGRFTTGRKFIAVAGKYLPQ